MQGYKYILFMLALLTSVGMRGQYNPTSPGEPGAPVTVYTLTVAADPSAGGSFNVNAVTSQEAGVNISLRAYNATNFTFESWKEDGEVISTSAAFTYTMPARHARLTAHYRYTPTSPTEPAEPVMPVKPVYSQLFLTASPAAAGSFSIASGNNYEVGSTVKVTANVNSNFTFTNWTRGGEVIGTARTLTYTMLDGDNALTANYQYTPSNPGEPAEPPVAKVYRKLYLQCNPPAGGYFNVESGNSYEVGTTVQLRAYNNQWYTFQNWTANGEVISTNSSFNYVMPADDTTLTANYTYNYNPSNPGEPAAATTASPKLYGMAESGMRGQTIGYPVYLENADELQGVTVVLRFPEQFTANTANVVMGERAAGHTLSVTALGDNSYRFDLTGSVAITGQNGKIFEVPVTIGTEATADSSYLVALSNGAQINADGSKVVISARNGSIFVKEVKEDGLYASFTYEKLQNRMKFTNQSSEKALSWTWDFGDGTTSNERDPLHVFAKSGYYDVRLTARGQTGTDIAEMTVLVNDESSWRVNGVFYLQSQETGVRTFSSAQTLLLLMGGSPIDGNVKILLEGGKSFDYPLSADNMLALNNITASLANGPYTLTFANDSDGSKPVLNLGASGDGYIGTIAPLFTTFGQYLVVDGIDLRLCGVSFNPSQIEPLKSQTLSSGEATSEVALQLISPDLTFRWTLSSPPANVAGYLTSGEGNIAPMSLTSEAVSDCQLVYNIIGEHEGVTFCEFTHTVTIKPAMIGTFTELLPADKAEPSSTTVTLQWNKIENAVYDVYLWNAANQQPTTPTVAGTTEQSYTSANFCQDGKTYCWQVVARNSAQQLASDIHQFTIHSLPNLHIYSLDCGEAVGGQKLSVTWTVKNDGVRATTQDETWSDNVWLVPDVYGGTNQATCRLMATVERVKPLAVGEQYTGSAEIELDYTQYGSYYLIVASDMSSVTSIEWGPVGGTIVNPYAPSLDGEGYRHLYALTHADGNRVAEEGETSVRSDNFFYKKIDIAAPSLDETDWAILQAAYQQMGNGQGWTHTWNFNSPTRSLAGLAGVQLRQGRVAGIDLSANKLTGGFPCQLLRLPCLETLNLSGNGLTGDMAQAMTAFVEQHPDAEVKLRQLNISSNQLAGNIGLFASYCPQLEVLNASDNCLNEVSPMISAAVTSLNLNKQAIADVLSLRLSDMAAGQTTDKLPNILLYNHASRKYATDINLRFAELGGDWWVTLAFSNGRMQVAQTSATNTYRRVSGDMLTVSVVDGKYAETGSTLTVKLSFDQGDANFDGLVDVLDLQATINYAFDDYKTLPFNFTAANLHADELINVQDVVGVVNRLLEAAPEGATTASNPDSRTMANTPDSRTNEAPSGDVGGASRASKASLTVAGGLLMLTTDVPVASFDIFIDGVQGLAVAQALQQAGFTCSLRQHAGGLRIIGYSMAGSTLPIGTTTIGILTTAPSGGESVAIAYAKLAGKDASEVAATVASATTAIGHLPTVGASANAVYDLKGRKVSACGLNDSKLSKGLYLMNGQKVVKR